ncbi:MAG: SGNH/GDSL hydrolase family protein [Planctomycetia bacterium]
MAFELVARMALTRPTMHLGVEMWKYAKSLKLRDVDPEVGHRHRPNAQRILMGVDVRTNSLGLRDVERQRDKPAATYRILVLGDSITFGWGVAFEKTFCQLVESSLNTDPPIPGCRFEVLNAGVGNLNTAMEVAYLKHAGVHLQPDLVLLAWFINDAEPPPVPRRGWLARHSYAYVWLDSASDSAMRRLIGRQDYRDYYTGLYRDENPGWTRCKHALRDLAAVCRDRGIPCRVLMIPELHSLGSAYEFRDVHDAVRRVCRQAGLPVLDLLEALPAVADARRYWVSPDDAHPNAEANDLLARAIDSDVRRALHFGNVYPPSPNE